MVCYGARTTYLASVLEHPSLLDHGALLILQTSVISQSSNLSLDQLPSHHLTVPPGGSKHSGISTYMYMAGCVLKYLNKIMEIDMCIHIHT